MDGRTDGRTGGIAIYPVPGPTAPAGDNKVDADDDGWVDIWKAPLPGGTAELINKQHQEADMMVTTSTCLVHVQVEIILTGYLVLTNRTVTEYLI